MTRASSFWRRLAAALSALVVAVIALGPSLDAVVCGDETGAIPASAELAMTAADHEAGHADHGGGDEACMHGHCHHGAQYVPTDLAVAGLQHASSMRHELSFGRVPISDPKFALIRPPRA